VLPDVPELSAHGAGLGEDGEVVVRELGERASGGALDGRVEHRLDLGEDVLHRRPRDLVETAVQALGDEDVPLPERPLGDRSPVEPLVAVRGELHPATGPRVGRPVVQRAASLGVPEDGGQRGVERDGVRAGAGQDQIGSVHRLPPVASGHRRRGEVRVRPRRRACCCL
jgi:hypothetical protein